MADQLNLFLPLTKVDMQTRQVWGRATQEVLDGHKEIFDYDSSVPFFQKWSETVVKRSGGKSKGNLRAMHQPIAAGKLVAIDFNNAEKAIDIGTYVTDDAEWQKVLDGVYTGFSVGGRYAKRWMDIATPGATRYTADPSEISLVDAPAVPTATFELIKADGTKEIRKFDSIVLPGDEGPREEVAIEPGQTEGAQAQDPEMGEVESDAVIAEVDPSDPAQEAAAVEGGEPAAVKETPPEWMGKFQEAAEQLSANIHQLIEIRKQEADREEQVTAELKLRGERVGIARRERSPLAPPPGHPSAWQSYADPANYAFPMEKAIAGEQIAAYNTGRGRDGYTPREWMVLGRRVARLASELFGVPYKFSPTTVLVERNPMEKNMTQPILQKDVAGILQEVQSQLNDATKLIGTDPSAAMSLLTQIQAAIDVTSNVTAANPANPSHPIAKADGPTPSDEAVDKCAKCDASLTKNASFCAKCGAKVEKMASAQDAVLKIIEQQGQLLKELTDKVSRMSSNPFSVLPVGDLNSIQDPKAGEETDPLAKALESGDLQAAFKAAGNDPADFYGRMNDIVVKRISDLGINVTRAGGIVNAAVES